MRKTLICSLIGLVGCTWMAGCQDKPDGAQTIIIELADPSDQVEETKEEMPEESVSESDKEMETGETQSEEMPEIIGFEENVEFAYKQVSSNDPIIGLLLENVIPDVQVKDFEITDAQAYQNGERVTPTGEITFTLNVEPDASVILYRLNADGELVSEALEVTDGAVSYESTGCGRWLILDTLLEQETESVSESDTEDAAREIESAAESLEGKVENEKETDPAESSQEVAKVPESKEPSTKAPETKPTSTKAPETKPNQSKPTPSTSAPTTTPSTAAPSTKAPETKAPETTAHTHNWVAVTTTVHHDAVTSQVWKEDSAAWDETVITKAAWDEQVLVQDAYDENKLVQDAYDEPVYEWVDICNRCGHVFLDPNEDINEHMAAGCWSSWHAEMMQTGSVHHDAVYQTVHHDAVYQTVHHDAETTVVHHDATGHYETVVTQAAWDETVVTGYTCSGCGATK